MRSLQQRPSALALARAVALASVLACVWLGLALSSAPAMAIEEPSYQQLAEDGAFSLRKYASVIVAETQVPGTLDQASSTGFRRLAGYIFGANHPSSANSAKNDKVTKSAPAPAKTTIAMTAPVTTYQQGPSWTVNFTMPAHYSLASLPIPDDGRVTLREVPGGTTAVIRFSGWVSESTIATKTALLRDWMAARGLVATGDPHLARYNPPWTLPFLRRNEILIPYRKAQ